MLGNKQFELSNHLGNVLTTVSDRKIPHTSDNITIDYYTSDITSAQDYYAGGMLMPGRNFSSNSYRFGFNGKLKDNEITGVDGASYDFGARIYDSRVGRWLSLDPSMKKYPHLSPYNAFENNPIYFKDPDGKDAEYAVDEKTKTITIKSTIYITGQGATKAKASEIQKDIMQAWGGSKGFEYKDSKGNVYTMKFDVKVVNEQSQIDNKKTFNFVRLHDKIDRSFVSEDGWTGQWKNNDNGDRLYAHEFGHLVGVDDQYYEAECNDNLTIALEQSYGTDPRNVNNYSGTDNNDIMGKAATYDPKNAKVNSKTIQAIGDFITGQKNNTGTINGGSQFQNNDNKENQIETETGCELKQSK